MELPSHPPIARPFEALLGLEQAAELLRLHPDTLKKKAQRREIPALKIGKRWRFRASLLLLQRENVVLTATRLCHPLIV